MAKFEYTGDGTVDIAGIGGVTRGDVIEVPDSLKVGDRADFKTSSGTADRTVEEPVKQPDQEPQDSPPADAKSGQANAPAASSQSTPPPAQPSGSSTASTTTPQGA